MNELDMRVVQGLSGLVLIWSILRPARFCSLYLGAAVPLVRCKNPPATF